VELDLMEADQVYETGDHVAIFPDNESVQVECVLYVGKCVLYIELYRTGKRKRKRKMRPLYRNT
jgi:sulfite reductase alpha subunit-like flavoprotein